MGSVTLSLSHGQVDRTNVTISRKFALQPGSRTYQAARLAFMTALLVWAAYSLAAAFQPTCPHDASSEATQFGLSRLIGDPAERPVTSSVNWSEFCCQDLHGRVVAQPSVLALPPVKGIPLAASLPMRRATRAVAASAPLFARAFFLPPRADSALYLRTQRLLI